MLSRGPCVLQREPKLDFWLRKYTSQSEALVEYQHVHIIFLHATIVKADSHNIIDLA